jgi:hypothetical protein
MSVAGIIDPHRVANGSSVCGQPRCSPDPALSDSLMLLVPDPVTRIGLWLARVVFVGVDDDV